MNVTITKTEELRIEDPATAEVIHVTITDLAAGTARLTINGGGQTNSCYWNNTGKLSAREFFLAASDSFIVGCLDPFGTLFRKIDPKILVPIVLIDIEKAETIDDEQKVMLSARTTEFAPISDVNGLQVLNNDLLTKVYGPMWPHQVADRFMGQHPLYTGLLARIATIRQVLAA